LSDRRRRAADNGRKRLIFRASRPGIAVALLGSQEATMKTKTTAILSLVSFLVLGFAGVANAGEGAARRGQVNVQATGTKAVVAGPAVVKVYSGFSGAKVFVADAASGTDADCAAGARQASGSALQADRIEVVTVGAGQVACVAGTGARSVELLWHAQPGTPAQAMVARR